MPCKSPSSYALALASAFVIVLAAGSASAFPGQFDTTFAGDGVVDEPAASQGYGVALQDDGKILVAAGWSGDRLRFYRSSASGPGAVVWLTTWDRAAEAQEAEAAARAIVAALPAAERGRHLVQRQGRAVIVLRNLAPELHRVVVAALRPVVAGLPASSPRAATPMRERSPRHCAR